MADKEQKQIELLTKLIGVTREKLGDLYELLEEMNRIVEGKAGMGALLKDLERGFDTAWCSRYAPGSSGRYVWAYVKDRPQMKRLLKTLDLDEILERASRFVQNEDPFFIRSRHTFGTFVATINQHARPAADGGAVSAPEGCLHVPVCESDAAHTRRRSQELRS